LHLCFEKSQVFMLLFFLQLSSRNGYSERLFFGTLILKCKMIWEIFRFGFNLDFILAAAKNQARPNWYQYNFFKQAKCPKVSEEYAWIKNFCFDFFYLWKNLLNFGFAMTSSESIKKILLFNFYQFSKLSNIPLV
jgi:hypothetical protein